MPEVKITIRHKDMWMLELLENNVRIKSGMGVKTDLGFEVMRLVKLAMFGNSELRWEEARKSEIAKKLGGVENEAERVQFNGGGDQGGGEEGELGVPPESPVEGDGEGQPKQTMPMLFGEKGEALLPFPEEGDK